MEAGWGGSALKLQGNALTVQVEGAAPVQLSLESLTGFTLLTPDVARAERVQAGPGGALVLGWLERGRRRQLAVPLPAPAFQVQLFVARLNQLKPEKDFQALPAKEALGRIGWRRKIPVWLLAGGALLGLLLIAATALVLSAR